VTGLIDEEIAQRAARGDRQALEQLCSLTWRQLYQFVYHRVQNREEAEDVTQEAYSRTLKGRPEAFSAGQFVSYLQTAALNVIRDRWRRGQTQQKASTLMASDQATPDAADEVARREVVEHALERLSPDYRQVVELRILMGLSTAETARRMGRTEAAIRTIQYRAIKALKEEIE